MGRRAASLVVLGAMAILAAAVVSRASSAGGPREGRPGETAQVPPSRAITAARGELWIEKEDVESLPMKGAAWRALLEYAKQPTSEPNLSDQDDPCNTRTLAKALVYARTGRSELRDDVIAACEAAIGTEDGGRTLALGRNLAAFVIAADLVELPDDVDRRFRMWLVKVTRTKLDGMTLVGTHEDRPNNWGTHAGASRAAVAVYLGDRKELERVATVFRGWLGDRSAYSGFRYRALDWQADPTKPVGVNPKGSVKDGHSIDGVLPDDQRRGGGFAWPPPRENYVYEALQGALVQAVILGRAGYDPWEWSDRALLRAHEWLHDEAKYPAEGDDCWQTHLVNKVYGKDFPAQTPTRPGKNVGFLDWTHGGK